MINGWKNGQSGNEWKKQPNERQNLKRVEWKRKSYLKIPEIGYNREQSRAKKETKSKRCGDQLYRFSLHHFIMDAAHKKRHNISSMHKIENITSLRRYEPARRKKLEHSRPGKNWFCSKRQIESFTLAAWDEQNSTPKGIVIDSTRALVLPSCDGDVVTEKQDR